MDQITAEMKRQSTAYALEMNIPRGELEFRFNKYWSEVKDILNPELKMAALKGGYREVKRERVVKAAGGPAEFYKPILAEVVQGWLGQQERQALTFNDVTVEEGVESYNIRALVYLEPEVKWLKTPPGIDEEPLTVKIPKQPEGLVQRMVELELNSAREKAVVLVPAPEGTEAAVDHIALLDAESVIDGQLWPAGSFTNNKWLLRKELFYIPEMMDALMGMRAGESKKLTAVLNDRFSEDMQGKSVDITLKVNQIYIREMPDVDDDLAKTHGYENLESYKKALDTQITQKLEEERKKLVQISLTSQLMDPTLVEIEPVPFVWMTTKAKEIYMQSRGMVRTEEELIAYFQNQQLLSGTPVTDKVSLLTFFAEKVAQQLVHDLVLRSWGKKKGVAGNTNLEWLPEYVVEVKRVLAAKTQIEEYEVQPSKE